VSFSPIEDIVDAIKRGEMVIMVDDADRENEGDLIIAAEDATPDNIGFMLRYTSGSSACRSSGSVSTNSSFR
jgi:3,4-dihydroxy 2-butanone 4-phosphate synthase / GTP cyclohydrolase II